MLETAGLGERVRRGDKDAFVEFFRRSGVGLTGTGPVEVVSQPREAK